MMKTENFVQDPYSFGLKDILFPEESRLEIKDEEKRIDVDKVKNKVESISGEELADLIKKNCVLNLAELVSALVVEVGLDEYFNFSSASKMGAQGFGSVEDKTVSSINTLIKANIEANCRININWEEKRELVYEVSLNLFYGPNSLKMFEKIKRDQELTEEIISFIEDVCSTYNTFMSSGERVESLYLKQLKKFLHVFTRVIDQYSKYMKPQISVGCVYEHKGRLLELGLNNLMKNTLSLNPDKNNFYVDFAEIVRKNFFFGPSLKMGVSYSIRDWGSETFYGKLGEEIEGVFFTSKSCGRDIYMCLNKPAPFDSFLWANEDSVLEEETVFLAKSIRGTISSPRYFDFNVNLEAAANKIWE